MSRRPRILVVDDQIGIAGGDRDFFLARVGCGGGRGATHPHEFVFHSGAGPGGDNSVPDVLAAVRGGWPDPGTRRHWAMVLLDVRFGDDECFGFTLLRAIREDPALGKDVPVVMLTSEDREKRGLAGKFQADGFLPKFDEARMESVLSEEALRQKILDVGLIEDDRPEGERLIGHSLPFLKVLRACRSAARRHGGGVVLYGETGTGKSELAAYIHHHSGFRDGPFVHWFADPANAALMKDELFGHWRGAHSEARSSEPGKIESAHGGTFFLDEVANLPTDVQQAFLQFREEDAEGRRAISRLGKFPGGDSSAGRKALESVVGGAEVDRVTGTIRIRVQVIAGTNANLEDEGVRKERQFLPDLHNALGDPIHCPSLNERTEDLPELFDHFVRLAVRRQRGARREFAVDDAVREILAARDWSRRGNVRDLERIARHAAKQLGDFDTIHAHGLPPEVLEKRRGAPASGSPVMGPPEASSAAGPGRADAPPAPLARISPGELARGDVAHLRRRAELLERVAEETRKIDAATGRAGRYQPTAMVARMLGVEVTPVNAKRIIAAILGDILQTPKYLLPAYRAADLEALRAWVDRRAVLMDLHRYASGQLAADDIGLSQRR